MISELDVKTCSVRHVYWDQDLFGGCVLCINGNYMAIGYGWCCSVMGRDASGILSLYETPTEMNTEEGNDGIRVIKPLKTFKNLVTPVTTIAINNDNSILVYASKKKPTHIRAIHLPSRSVFSNWPARNERLKFVTSVAISGDNRASDRCEWDVEYLVTGEMSGKVCLYRFNHFYHSAVCRQKVTVFIQAQRIRQTIHKIQQLR